MQRREPFLTRRFDLALQFASGLHHQQFRKGTVTPYISHLLSVCGLVLEAGGDEDQAIAALLHDAVEDQGGLATLDTIRRLFGDRVSRIVECCSDSTTTNPAEKLRWRERKERYLEHLRNADEDVLIVAIADKLHNAKTIISEHRQVLDQIWEKFNAPKTEQMWFYGALLEILQNSALAPKSLLSDLEQAVNELNRLA